VTLIRPNKEEDRTAVEPPWECRPQRKRYFEFVLWRFDAAIGRMGTSEGEPYTRKNGTQFDWFRSKMVGEPHYSTGEESPYDGPYFKKGGMDGLVKVAHRLRRCQALLRQDGINLLASFGTKEGDFTTNRMAFFPSTAQNPRRHDF